MLPRSAPPADVHCSSSRVSSVRRWKSNPSGKYSQERLTRGTVTTTMRRAEHPSGCARCGAGAGCSTIKYHSLSVRSQRGIIQPHAIAPLLEAHGFPPRTDGTFREANAQTQSSPQNPTQQPAPASRQLEVHPRHRAAPPRGRSRPSRPRPLLAPGTVQLLRSRSRDGGVGRRKLPGRRIY